MKAKQKRPLRHRLLSWLTTFISAASLGYCLFLLRSYTGERSFFIAFGFLTLLLLLLLVSNLLHIILHELGHFVGGLLTGRRLFYLCFGSFYIVRRPSGRLALGRLKVPGIGGLCAMTSSKAPAPYKLYLLGGSLANLLLGVVCAVLAWRAHPFVFRGMVLTFPLPFCILLMPAVTGITALLTNLVPMRTLGHSSDGHQLLTLCRSAESRADYQRQQPILCALQQEIRLKDMPDEWFSTPPADQITSPYIRTIALDAVYRMIEQGEYAAALERAKELLHNTTYLPLQELALVQHGTLCELLTGQPGEMTERFLSPEMKRLQKLNSGSLSTLTTQYAVALLHQNDRLAADDLLAAHFRVAVRHPFRFDVQSEGELIERIEAVWESRKEATHEEAQGA